MCEYPAGHVGIPDYTEINAEGTWLDAQVCAVLHKLRYAHMRGCEIDEMKAMAWAASVPGRSAPRSSN